LLQFCNNQVELAFKRASTGISYLRYAKALLQVQNCGKFEDHRRKLTLEWVCTPTPVRAQARAPV